MRVEQFLTDSAGYFPDKVAVIAGESRITYSQLDSMANRLANVLQAQGIRRGDRVVIFTDNSIEGVVGIFATLKAGGVFSPVNPTTKPDKLSFILNNCRARGIITQARLTSVVNEALAQSPSVLITMVSGGDPDLSLRNGLPMEMVMQSAPACAPLQPGIDIDLGMLIYTSGSTGFPKGVMMTHQNIVTAATSITTYLQNTPDDIILSVLPMSFDYGLYQVLMSVKMGATIVLEKSFAFPNMILQRLAEERATGFPLVPTIAAILLQMKNLEAGSFPHLRYITNTAAALPPAHIQQLQELFPTTQIYSMYGLTECKRCTYLPPEQLAIRPGSVGKAIPNTEAYVINDQGEQAAAGEVGELVIRGGHVMQGYWENSEATDRVLRPGPYPWEKVLHTGDLFRTDEEGFLYFVGRKDDIIKTRGEKVSPKEIENVLYAIDGVREAAAIGIPDPILGMSIRAVIVLAEGISFSEQDILRHCARHLEDFMVPKSVEFRTELPKTSTERFAAGMFNECALRFKGTDHDDHDSL